MKNKKNARQHDVASSRPVTAEKKKYLRGIGCSGADCARHSVKDWSIADCEYVLGEILFLGKTMRQLLERRARKVFRESVRGEETDNAAAEEITSGLIAPTLCANYPTLRKALFLCPQRNAAEYVSGTIRDELKTRFPWGSCK